MVWYLVSAEEQQAIETLNNESDRSAGIVAATIVERRLTTSLTAFLHQNDNITSQFFRTSGPLGSFSNKIDLALLTGLCGSEAHRDLATMKDIRNAFAHSLAVTNFKSQKISALTRNLKLVEKFTIEETQDAKKENPGPILIGIDRREERLADPRERYLLSARVFIMGFSAQTNLGMPKPWF
jgi:DNA-binding MltR family transcriptional regulator